MDSKNLIGVGLRPTHYPHLENLPKTHSNWFEATSENYMNTEGRPLEMLLKIREQYPIALHGVSLSIGSDVLVDYNYLAKLKKLIDRTDPIIVSDHLCWSQIQSETSHDLLPLPFTEESLSRVVENVNRVQEFLNRPILLENISYYIKFKESTIDEADFMNSLCQKTGCKLLIDLNNIFVNSVNHKFNPLIFFDKISLENIAQLHLAGPTQEEGYLFDTHSTRVPDQVWSLFAHTVLKKLCVPIIIEWDQDVPEFNSLETEVIKTKKIIDGGQNELYTSHASV